MTNTFLPNDMGRGCAIRQSNTTRGWGVGGGLLSAFSRYRADSSSQLGGEGCACSYMYMYM